MSWRDQALCRGKTDLFFPPDGERPYAAEVREAKCFVICSKCPVIGPCGRQARRLNRRHPARQLDGLCGVWAGVSFDLPKRERRRRAA